MFYYLRISRRVVLTKCELSSYFPWQKNNFKMDRRWISRKCGEKKSKKSQKGKRACREFPKPPEFFACFLSYAAMVFADRGTADGIMEIYIYICISDIYIYIYIRGIFLRKDIVHCSENMSRVSLCSSLQFAFRTPVSTTMRKLHDALLVSSFLHPYYH